jgi:hypothetical protein
MYLSLTFIENFHAFSTSHVFKTLFQFLHFSIFLHAQKINSNINFHALKNLCEHWGLSPPKKKTQEQSNFTIDFVTFLFEPNYFGLCFCCP